ncbi:MAG TPA: hypothetical protein VKD72_36565, partial [Gemmataceae bacterium]|nr:hypothetical protein [Gemmataceae bacterium]
DKKTDKSGQPDKKDPSKGSPNDKKDKEPDKDKPKNPDKDNPKNPDKGTIDFPKPIDKPNDDPKAAGRFVSKGEALVHQTKEGEWERIPSDGTVSTGEPLVSLPGYKSELRLNSGIRLLLWGTLPEIPLRTPLLESAVTLHGAASGLDADLTLLRGRIYLTNRKEKGPARVRVRFWREEVWDVTLEEPDTTAGLEFFSTYYNPDPRLNIKFRSGEEPLAVLVLHVTKGRAQVKVNYDTFPLQAPPGPALIYWNNKDKNRTKQEGPIPSPRPCPTGTPTSSSLASTRNWPPPATNWSCNWPRRARRSRPDFRRACSRASPSTVSSPFAVWGPWELCPP